MAVYLCSPRGTRPWDRPQCDPGRAAESLAMLPLPVMTIYTVSAIAINEAASANEPPLVTALETQRVFGWFPTELAARTAVDQDHGGMEESLYTHLVIEEVQPGVHGPAKVIGWFEWKPIPSGIRGRGMNPRWKACKPPRWSKGVTNWSMG